MICKKRAREDSEDDAALQRIVEGMSSEASAAPCDGKGSSLVAGLQKALQRSLEATRSMENGDNRAARQALHQVAAITAQTTIDIQAILTSLPPITLTDDCLLEIFRHLSTMDLTACECVNKQWRALILSATSFWCDKIELKGSQSKISKQWNFVKKRQNGANTARSLIISLLSSYFAEDEDEKASHLNLSWKNGFLAIFPFPDVKEVKYTGRSYTDRNISADLSFWSALGACTKLQALHFNSIAEKDVRYNQEGLSIFDQGEAITKCKLHTLEVEASADFFPIHLDLKSIKIFKIKVVLEASLVRLYLQSIATHVEELQICDVEYENIEVELDESEAEYYDPAVHPPHDVELQDFKKESELLMPNLIKYAAIGVNRKGTDTSQDESDDCTTRLSYKISAPNLTELRYCGFLGWDETLFKSCWRTLKVVYFEIFEVNGPMMLKAMARLRACEKLTLKVSLSYSSRHFNPFSEDYKSQKMMPSKPLTSLKELTIMNDTNITGGALLRFVEEKKRSSISCPLLKLTLQGCTGIRQEREQHLGAIVPQFSFSVAEGWRLPFAL